MFFTGLVMFLIICVDVHSRCAMVFIVERTCFSQDWTCFGLSVWTFIPGVPWYSLLRGHMTGLVMFLIICVDVHSKCAMVFMVERTCIWLGFIQDKQDQQKSCEYNLLNRILRYSGIWQLHSFDIFILKTF
jgi:hypothetical protein